MMRGEEDRLGNGQGSPAAPFGGLHGASGLDDRFAAAAGAGAPGGDAHAGGEAANGGAGRFHGARLWRAVREIPVPLLAAGLGAATWLVVAGVRRSRRPRLWGERFEAGARAAGRSAGEIFEERPLAAGAAAMALGLLAGLALPATRREDELLGERRDELLESAREAGKDALEQSRMAARGAGERVRESLREQELTPEQLAAKVRRVASDAVSSVQEAERDFLRGLDEGAGAGVEPAPARDF
jgi:hypothetical protein